VPPCLRGSIVVAVSRSLLWHGILDTWYGIVYDPTGIVLCEKGERLIGDELVSAERLYENWNFCSFT